MSERDSICALTEKLGSDYRPVTGHPGYFVRRDGTAWTMWRMSRCERGRLKRVLVDSLLQLRMSLNPNGYTMLRIGNSGKYHCMVFSRVMLTEFVGPPKEGQHACHNSGDITDNRIENLRWDDRIGNMRDKKLHGTEIYGSRNGMFKYDDALVVAVRERYAQYRCPGSDRASPGWVNAVCEEFSLTRKQVIYLAKAQKRRLLWK
jgi:hypothetical protein